VPWAQISTTLGQANHVEQEGLRCAVHLLAYLLEGGRVHDKLIYSYLGSEVGWKRWVFHNAEKGILMGFYGILMDFRRILMGFYRVSLDCNAAYFAKLANRTLKTIGWWFMCIELVRGVINQQTELGGMSWLLTSRKPRLSLFVVPGQLDAARFLWKRWTKGNPVGWSDGDLIWSN